MSCRAVIAFMAALILIRLAGQRTFGKRSAVDNVILIMLGAVLSRAVVGASPALPVFISSLVLCLFHRLLAWLSVYNDSIGKLVKGDKYSLYKNGKENQQNRKSLLLSEKDLMEGVRLQMNENNFKNVAEIFMERNGEISVIKKQLKAHKLLLWFLYKNL